MKWLWLWLWLAVVSGCALINPNVPTPRAMVLHEYSDTSVAHSIAASDGVAIGLVVKVRREDDFDVDCHFPTQLQGCRPQYAWSIEVKGQRMWYLWAFPFPGQFLPIAPGMRAIFFFQNVWVTPFSKCSHMGQFAQACVTTEGTMVQQVVDTLDILPLADSARVDSLWRARKRS